MVIWDKVIPWKALLLTQKLLEEIEENTTPYDVLLENMIIIILIYL